MRHFELTSLPRSEYHKLFAITEQKQSAQAQPKQQQARRFGSFDQEFLAVLAHIRSKNLKSLGSPAAIHGVLSIGEQCGSAA